SATISTGTTGKVNSVTFHVQLDGRTMELSATGSGSRWSATLDGAAFGYDHGSGTVRASATGPTGSAESGDGHSTIADCPNCSGPTDRSSPRYHPFPCSSPRPS